MNNNEKLSLVVKVGQCFNNDFYIHCKYPKCDKQAIDIACDPHFGDMIFTCEEHHKEIQESLF